MGRKIRTRKDKLRYKLSDVLNTQDKDLLNDLLDVVEEYENDNLVTIEKLKRNKKITTNAIHGGLKQVINAHGPITRELIGSAGKRIYGALLTSEKKQRKISIKTLIIGIIMGIILTYIII